MLFSFLPSLATKEKGEKCVKLQRIRFTHFNPKGILTTNFPWLPLSFLKLLISRIFYYFFFRFEFPCRSFSCEHKYSGKIIFPFHAAATVRIYLNIPLFWQLCYNNKMAGMGSFLEDFSEQL